MALFPFILLATLVVNFLIGLLPLLTNPVRPQNRLFFVFTTTLSLWAAFILAVVRSGSLDEAETYIRLASLVSCFFPIVFHLICLAIAEHETGLRQSFWRIRRHLALSLAFAAIALTPLYILGVKPSSVEGAHQALPITINGPAYPLVNGYVIIGLLAVGFLFARRLRTADGIRRTEMQYVFLGVAVGVLYTGAMVILLPILLPEWVTQRFAPFGLVPMNLAIAYGIATRRLMDVSTVLQRMLAYALLAVYLAGLYTLVLAAGRYMLGPVLPAGHFLPHLLATLVVVFSMTPVHGVLQQLARRLFITGPALDVREAAAVGSEIFVSISTTEALLGRFREVVGQAGMDADRVRVFLAGEGGAMAEAGAREGAYPPAALEAADPLVRWLARFGEPLAAYTLKRMRQTPELDEVSQSLRAADAELAVGIYYKGELTGVVLVGRRRSGRIFTAAEQDGLQVLCNQLAVALENARLYTAVRNNKMYNDVLLDSLPSGVVALDDRGRVTVFNREAQRLLGRAVAEVLGQPYQTLPEPLAGVLHRLRQTGESVRDRDELLLPANGEEVPIRVSGAVFRGEGGRARGALAIFSDLTLLRKLEQQVRRSDRLASIGTLSAGMAHEIKNPLVTIKTFTDLLPERFDDAEFRERFGSLVAHEVRRIDTLVNQLLRFARPAKPDLKPLSLRTLVEASLRLVEEPLRQKGIRLRVQYDAGEDTIRADRDLLDQALVNLFLNAIESMDGEGRLEVTTARSAPDWPGRAADGAGPADPCMRLSIRDTGLGIPAENLARVFDPFFTTKSTGTGLGLAIAHGIIQEHRGLVDLESEPGRGTTFHLYFPLVNQEVPA